MIYTSYIYIYVIDISTCEFRPQLLTQRSKFCARFEAPGESGVICLNELRTHSFTPQSAVQAAKESWAHNRTSYLQDWVNLGGRPFMMGLLSI